MEGNHHQDILNGFKSGERKKKSWKDKLVFFGVPFHVVPIVVGVLLVVVLFFVLVVGAMALPHIDNIKNVTEQSLKAKDSLELAKQSLLEQNFVEAEAYLESAKMSFERAEIGLAKTDDNLFFKFPYVKSQVVVARDVLLVGKNTSELLADISSFGNEIMVILESDDLNLDKIDNEKRKELLDQLILLGDSLKDQNTKISETSDAYNRLKKQQNSAIWSSLVEQLNETLPTIFKSVDHVVVASEIVPSLVGHNKEKVYLFMLQNNHEIRPSGGFLGQYGIVKVENGALNYFKTDNIYNLDVKAIDTVDIEPPAPIEKYMGQDHWYMRDSNWWPDFPTSAINVEKFYHLEDGPEENIDGVISINPDFIADLIGLVGEITLEGIIFTKDNFVDELEYQVEMGYLRQGISLEERKEIMSDLTEELQTRLFALPMSQWNGLIDVLKKNMDEKFILIYSKDDELQKYIEHKYWAGRVINTNDDYIQIVDANLAALKTDRVMDRSYLYEMVQSDGKMNSLLTLTYKNNGWFDWRTTRYRSYTRVYVPKGSVLKSLKVGGEYLHEDDIDIEVNFDKAVFGFFFEVEPGREKDIVVKYELPKSIVDMNEDGDYKVLLQKQPGVPEIDFSISLKFDKEIKSYGKKKGLKAVNFTEKLVKDQLYRVEFE